MARKKTSRSTKKEKLSKKESTAKDENKKSLKDETLNAVVAIIFFVVAVFLVLASFGNGGLVGEKLYSLLNKLLGVGYFLIPILLTILGTSYIKTIETKLDAVKISGSLLFVVSGLGMIDLVKEGSGGIIGKLISSPLVKLFDFWVSLIFLFALLLISLLIILDTHIRKLNFFSKIFALFKKEETNNETETEKSIRPAEEEIKLPKEVVEEVKDSQDKVKKILNIKIGGKEKGEEKELNISAKESSFLEKKYTLPPVSLLSKDKGKPVVGDVKANANIIKRSLGNFGINVEMDEVSIGPSVTRYALKPAEGVKLSRIVGLQNDLSLALAAHPLRIEAPIPGKSLVGIEIPNSTKTIVGLASLLSSREFQHSDKNLLMALGKDISGKAYFGNLTKAPHMLIAGTTGAGKSVTVHNLIVSMLFRNPPQELKFIMVDPKRVELTLYNKIPHLLTPVITDAKKTILSLKWAIKEMERRYDVLETESVRDIQSYHQNVYKPALAKLESKGAKATEEERNALPEAMPYIVIVIDELADIMQTYPRELEAAIVRLAQMSRAVGIHLILSTQRPSVNVITGLIKANVPTRLALQVASQIDSRTILDTSGAEKLLGAGDMLYLSGNMSKPMRLQSAYISEKEVKKVVKFLKDAYMDEIPEEVDITTAEQEKNSIFDIMSKDSVDDDDDLYEEAKDEVIKVGKASTSYLQRKLRIGYSRAARIMDILEDRGVIGPAEGSKPREVLVGKEGDGDDEE